MPLCPQAEEQTNGKRGGLIYSLAVGIASKSPHCHFESVIIVHHQAKAQMLPKKEMNEFRPFAKDTCIGSILDQVVSLF